MTEMLNRDDTLHKEDVLTVAKSHLYKSCSYEGAWNVLPWELENLSNAVFPIEVFQECEIIELQYFRNRIENLCRMGLGNDSPHLSLEMLL